MNDCRFNIKRKKMSIEDKNRLNISVVQININNWPILFTIANRNIKKNEELFLFYGKDYGYVMEQRHDKQLLINQNIKYVTSQLDKM